MSEEAKQEEKTEDTKQEEVKEIRIKPKKSRIVNPYFKLNPGPELAKVIPEDMWPSFSIGSIVMINGVKFKIKDYRDNIVTLIPIAVTDSWINKQLKLLNRKTPKPSRKRQKNRKRMGRKF